jgi:putative DNA methylase
MSIERRYPKRLIEVDLPIKQISAHARREKSIRHTSRAHLDGRCTCLVGDAAANRRGGNARDWEEPVAGGPVSFIADFANWDNSTNKDFLETARRLTGWHTRLWAEYIPKYGPRLPAEVRRWGAWVKRRAEEELGRFYPEDPGGAVPIAFLWARTIRCEGPGCGAEVPLVRSLWLSKKRGRCFGMRLVPRTEKGAVEVEIVESPKAVQVNEGTVRRGSATCPLCGHTTPVASVRTQLKARSGGLRDPKLLCVVTTRPGQQGRFYRLPTDEDLKAVRAADEEQVQRKRKHKGAMSLVPEEHLPVMSGVFNAPIYGHNTWGSLFTSRQALALTTLVRLVREAAERCRAECATGLAEAVATCLALVVDRQADKASSLARWDTSRDNIANTFGRQALPMVWDFAEANPFSGSGGDWDNALGWVAGVCEANVSTAAAPGHTQLASATAHPLPDDAANAFITDPPYYNAVPYADLSDFFYVWLRRTLGDVHPDLFSDVLSPKNAEICEMAGWDSERYPEKGGAWFEAHMKQAMAEGRRVLAPAGVGLVVFAHKSTAGWEAQLQAMVDAGWTMTASWPIDTEMGSRLRAMNSAVLASSVHLVCRPREHADGSLLDTVGDWRAVLRELPVRIHDWMPRLARDGVVGADAIFACLGPALEIFSRYSHVEKASGERVELREYLEQVWAAVAREALSMIFEDADTTGLEEDARLTAMWLWTLSTGTNGGSANRPGSDSDADDGDEEEGTAKTKPLAGFALEFDAARKIAQGLGAHLEDLSRVVEIKGNRARLLSVAERTRHLFGKDQAQRTPARRAKKVKQFTLFEELEAAEEDAGWGDVGLPPVGESTLDRIHQAMVLFAAGRGEALKRFLVEEGVGGDVRYWKLAQALSVLYPPGTDEKRWVDGVLARKKGLGF